MTHVLTIECAIPTSNQKAANKALNKVIACINEHMGEDVVYFDACTMLLSDWDAKQARINHE